VQITSLVLGIVAAIGMFIGIWPCLGWFNWINIPFAVVGLIICAVAVGVSKQGENKNFSIAGVILCSVAIVVGILRLILGAGVI